jgi:hypothetical protein
MRLGRARILAAIAAISTLAGVLAATANPAASATTAVSGASVSGASVALAASAATPLPAGAARVGAMPAQTPVSIDVALNLGNQAGLDALLNGVTNKKSPYYRHFLAKGQFGPEFGLSLTQISLVTSALRSLGLDPGQVDPARLDIPVTATAAAIDRAFRITMIDYRLADGRIAYANSAAPKVPASVAPYIEGVLGLDNVYLAQQLGAQVSVAAKPVAAKPVAARPVTAGTTAGKPAASSRVAAGPKACAVATDTAISYSGYTADQFAEHYYMTSLYQMGDLGQGVHVAVAELERNLAPDIVAYEHCYGIHTPVHYITVAPGLPAGAGSGEAALDIENIAGLAPDATIDDYQTPNSGTALLDIATKVLDNDTDQVLSISYGLCEADAGPSLLSHYQTVFSALNAEEITVVAAAGDVGPAGCYNASSGKKAPQLSVMSPASAIYVTSVGGTTMESASPLSPELAWNGTKDNPGAGGGGISTLCMPFYQDYNQINSGFTQITGIISKYSQPAKFCANSHDPHGYRRQLPDVSADGSGSSPYIVYYDKAWTAFYGTSGATTVVAAEAALVDASAYCSAKGWSSGPAGILPQDLYAGISSNNLIVYLATPPVIVRDITKGDTDDKGTGYTGGLYPATKGYDMASGLGTPLLTSTWRYPAFDPGLALNMCWENAPVKTSTVSTTSVSPAYGRAGKPVNVTVHGTGILQIPYANQAEINTDNNLKPLTQVWANCTSHTACKVTIPAQKPGTYQIELLPGDFLPCRKCRAYVSIRLAGPPHIAKLSRDSGGRGTKIVIHGGSFVGVTAVYFGSKKGTTLKVISPTELSVVVPAGSGKVKVMVVAVGGNSNKITFTY